MTQTPSAVPAVLREPEFRQLFCWEVQRATRYQDFLTLCLIELAPSGPLPSTARDSVAQRLVSTLRASDIVGIVGDDIAVLLVRTAEDEARGLVERIQRQAEGALRLGSEGAAPAELALRLAIASFPGDATSDAELLAHARIGLGRLS